MNTTDEDQGLGFPTHWKATPPKLVDVDVTPEQEAAAAELHRVRSIIDRIHYRPDSYRFVVEIDKTNEVGRVYMQIEHDRPDAFTGVMGVGRGGKAYLSPHMTRSEIVRRAFGLALAYEEHEVREFFRYTPNWGGTPQAVFGPHIDVEALAEAADQLDVRS